MPKIIDKDTQRADIRRAARRVFAERGLAGTGLGHVAEAAGMGRSSLYHYYADKEALVADLAREMLAEERLLFEEVAGGEGDPAIRLDMLVGTLAHIVVDIRELGRVMLELWAAQVEEFRPYFAELRRALAALLAEGQRDGAFDPYLDPEETAAVVIGMIDGILLQSFVDPDAFGDADALARTLVDATRRMVAP